MDITIKVMGLDENISIKISNMGALCALMVVFIHMPHSVVQGSAVWWACQILTNSICRMAVPFFFAASGYLLAGKLGQSGWYSDAVRKRIRTLIVPLLIWNVLYFIWPNVLTVMANCVHGRAALCGVSSPSVSDILRILALDIFHEPYLNVLWFVRTLFIFVLMSPLLARLANIWVVGFLWVVQCLINPTLGGEDGALAFTLLKGSFPILGAAPFMLGMMLRKRGFELTASKRAGLIALVATIFIFAINVQYGNSVTTKMAYGLAIPLAGYGAWTLCPSRKWPEFITGAAFAVYVMHQFVLEVLPSAWIWSRPYNLLGFLSFPVAAYCLCLVVFSIMKRMFPILARVVYGGRA